MFCIHSCLLGWVLGWMWSKRIDKPQPQQLNSFSHPLYKQQHPSGASLTPHFSRSQKMKLTARKRCSSFVILKCKVNKNIPRPSSLSNVCATGTKKFQQQNRWKKKVHLQNHWAPDKCRSSAASILRTVKEVILQNWCSAHITEQKKILSKWNVFALRKTQTAANVAQTLKENLALVLFCVQTENLATP